jgi:hypothetical protein
MSCLGPLFCFAFKTFKLLCFPIFWLWWLFQKCVVRIQLWVLNVIYTFLLSGWGMEHDFFSKFPVNIWSHVTKWTGEKKRCVKFQFWYCEVGSMNISCKISNDKVLIHLELKWKVLPGPLKDLSAGWNSAPQAHSGMSIFNFNIGGRFHEYLVQNSQRQRSCPFGVQVKCIVRTLMAGCDSAPQAHSRV